MINSFVADSAYFGVAISLCAYGVGVLLKNKFKSAIFNPLLISIAISIVAMLLLNIDYDTYYSGARFLSYLLTPATVCLAIPLYEQLESLRKNYKAIILGVGIGSMTSIVCVVVMTKIFALSQQEFISFLPKSITTAIGMDLSMAKGGYASLTVAAIVITGVIGNMIAEPFCKLLKITEPVAKGVAIGTSSHALGTAKAIEIGEIEGAISGLAIVICGMLTVVWCEIITMF